MKLQQLAEEKVGFLIVFTLIVVSVGLIVEVVPLFGTKEVITATKGVKPYSPLQVVGRDIYVQQLPLANDPPLPRRNRALRALFRGRRIGV